MDLREVIVSGRKPLSATAAERLSRLGSLPSDSLIVTSLVDPG
jgi:hypothetical protein